jgi:S-formylglutathione hydrolase FrmB
MKTMFKKQVLLVFWTLCAALSWAQKHSIVLRDSFYSPAVGLQLKYTAILPATYHTQTDVTFPIVYLLHGHTGNYTSWLTYAQLPLQLVTQYNCIIILPDGGNSWYVNWTGHTDRKPQRWEDMLVKDLLPLVAKRYRSKTDRQHRAIGGLSMGGFGALSVGLRHPDLFGFVFSSAGAINFCQNIKREMARDTLDWNSPELWSDGDRVINVPGFSTQRERTPAGLVFKTPADADQFDPYLLLEKLDAKTLPYLHLDCGLKDDFLTDAQQFGELIRKKSPRYSFLQMPGAHEVPYWQQAIAHTFLIMQQEGVFEP